MHDEQNAKAKFKTPSDSPTLKASEAESECFGAVDGDGIAKAEGEEPDQVGAYEVATSRLTNDESGSESTNSEIPLGLSEPKNASKTLQMDARVNLLTRRLVALIIDQVICCSLVGLMIFPIILVGLYLFGGPLGLDTKMIMQPFIVDQIGLTLFAFWFQLIIYCAKFESSEWQATPGKQIMGLKVTDSVGKRMSFRAVADRLLSQYLSTVLIVTGISWLVSSINPNFHIDAALVSLTACFLVSLASRRGQTLFDLITHRIVAVEKWSPTHNNLKTDSKTAVQMLFRTANNKRDWPVTIAASLATINLILAIPICLIFMFAKVELDLAPWQTQNAVVIEKDQHYNLAKKLLKHPSMFASMWNFARENAGLQPTLEDFQRAAFGDAPWGAHYEYAIELEQRGDLHAADAELKQSLKHAPKEKNTALFKSELLKPLAYLSCSPRTKDVTRTGVESKLKEIELKMEHQQ